MLAKVYAEQTYLAVDENAELVHVLTICIHHYLTPEATAQILDSLSLMKYGQS